MIVTKTPLRISFFGGGSDIPAFYVKNRGMTLSATIDSYIYLAVNHCVAKHIKVIYSQLEKVYNVEDIQHDRVKNILKLMDISSNLEICSFSDVTTKGTGLGSSSSFTVGLLAALDYHKNGPEIYQKHLAELACHVEIDLCGDPIGKQDQYAAAYGGFNSIEYYHSDADVYPIDLSDSIINELNSNLILFNTKIKRQASDILVDQVKNTKNNQNTNHIRNVVDIAYRAKELLCLGKLDEFGGLLDLSWSLKKKFSDNISNQSIDELYERAKNKGAIGGKLLGAGGGGYFMVYCKPKDRNNIIEELKEYPVLDFKFNKEGSKVINI